MELETNGQEVMHKHQNGLLSTTEYGTKRPSQNERSKSLLKVSNFKSGKTYIKNLHAVQYCYRSLGNTQKIKFLTWENPVTWKHCISSIRSFCYR